MVFVNPQEAVILGFIYESKNKKDNKRLIQLLPKNLKAMAKRLEKAK